MINKLNRKWKSAQEVQSQVKFWSQRMLDSNAYQVSLPFVAAETQPTKNGVKFPQKIAIVAQDFMIATYDST